MSKISNIITMLELLQSGRKYSISELSNKLEVSKRMIRLYKEDLEKAGIYLDTIMGPYGGYVLNQSIRMPVRKFKMKDAKLLDRYIKDEKNKDIPIEDCFHVDSIVLKIDNKFFFPVFSAADEMRKSGDNSTAVKCTFLYALSLAMNSKEEVSGIVINPFTEPFVVDREFFGVLKEMESSLE